MIKKSTLFFFHEMMILCFPFRPIKYDTVSSLNSLKKCNIMLLDRCGYKNFDHKKQDETYREIRCYFSFFLFIILQFCPILFLTLSAVMARWQSADRNTTRTFGSRHLGLAPLFFFPFFFSFLCLSGSKNTCLVFRLLAREGMCHTQRDRDHEGVKNLMFRC